MRDIETDRLLMRLRALYNQHRWAELWRHIQMVSDWLEERNRAEEAEQLRSGHWELRIRSIGSAPPECRVMGTTGPVFGFVLYMSSRWIHDEGHLTANGLEGWGPVRRSLDKTGEVLFDGEWMDLSEEGHCDAWGGAEYRRVLDSWVAAGLPRPIRRYILEEANRCPDSDH